MATTTPQHRYGPTHRPSPRPSDAKRRTAVLAATAGLILAATTVISSASARPTSNTTNRTPATTNTGKIYFGVDGTVSQAATGQPVARHLYGELSSTVPSARMVTMNIDGYTYASIAAAAPGSSTYANILRWADTIGARDSLTFFGFVHEPETSDQAHFGTTSQYLAAYRHVVNIFRSQHLANVRYVWQMTAYAFVAKGAYAAINYYPGDTYVDVVAEDPYNWDNCGPGGPWRDLGTAASPALGFAEARDKLAILAEFASQAGPGRASWLASAKQWLIQNRGEIQAAFYFDHPPTTPQGHACNWSLTSPTDIAAFRNIVNDTTYFTS